MTATDDLYANDGNHIYLRIEGIYYRRTVGKEWERLHAELLPDIVRWNKLADKQRAAFEPGLPK